MRGVIEAAREDLLGLAATEARNWGWSAWPTKGMIKATLHSRAFLQDMRVKFPELSDDDWADAVVAAKRKLDWVEGEEPYDFITEYV